jgi:hypothetical protein
MNEAELQRLPDRFGSDIALEVCKRLATALEHPELRPFADTLPDYFASNALWRRQMETFRAPQGRRERPPRDRPTPSGDPSGYVRGAAHPSARLNDELVRAIRRRRAEGESPSAIASDLGVSRRTIHLILSGQRWAHVADDPSDLQTTVSPHV